MVCNNCGAEIGANESFCGNCGAEVDQATVMADGYPEDLFQQDDCPEPPVNDQPAQPQYAQPAQPQYAQPAQPQYAQPAQPQYAQPTQPQYAQPVQPQYAQPVQPQYQPPQYQQPMYGQPMYGQQAPVLSPQDEAEMQALSKSILAFGIAAIACACSFFASFLGIVFGPIAISKAKQFAARGYRGNGRSITGKVLGIVGLVLGIILTIYLIIYVVFIGALIANY